MAEELKITITATDKASAVFDTVVDSAEKIGPALDEAAGGADRFGPAVEDAVNSLKPLPGALDSMGKSAKDAAKPLDQAGSAAAGLGDAIGVAGEKIPGAAGDIVSSIGDIVTAAEQTGTSVDKAAIGMLLLQGAAIGLAAALGPVVIGAALSAAGAAVGALADLLGGGDGLSDRLDETRANAAKLNTEILKTAAGIENAGQALRLFEGGTVINEMVEDYARLIELQAVFQGGNPSGDFAAGQVPGITSYNEAIAETISLSEELGLSSEDIVHGTTELGGALDSLAESQGMYNQLLAVTGPGQDAVRQRLGELVTGLQDGTISTEEFNAQLTWMVENLQSAYVAPALAAEALAAFSKAAYDAAVNVGLLDTAVEQLQAAGLDSLAIDVAVNLDQSALESTFNIIVGGTNKLAAASQAVADWADGLANAEDGLSVLGELYEDGLISLDDYSAGVAANTRIQQDNAAIQSEIQAIQAQHLPLMAELTEQQRAYVESLGDLSEEQQIAALGFMDAAQSAKAMELAYLAADAATGALGDTGEATATKIIAAAANADPVMKQMLLDMGLISEGAEGEIIVNFPEGTSITESVDNLTASIDALTTAIGGTPPIHTETNAADTQVEVDNLTGAIGAVPPSTTTTTSSNAADTQVGVDNLTGAIIGIPDSHNTSITATDNASGTISSVISQLNSIPAATYATVYVNTVSSGLPAGTAIGGRLGGVMGYSNGGMVMAQLAEAGPELLSFRDGGQAIVPHPGVYMVERGTSVTTAPATAAVLENAARSRGGRGVNFYGPVTLQPVGQDAYGAISSAAVRRGR